MTTLAILSESRALIRPQPRSPISIRVARSDGGADLKFIDALQKKHSKQVGFLRTGDIERYIANGGVLIAEEIRDEETERRRDGVGETSESESLRLSVSPSLSLSRPTPIGYVLFKDKYLHREELGVCFQLNVAPDKQRGLVGAALIQTAFEHCAYGTKLFCCWCAQDIDANHFWESIGFVPLAYRAGSRGKAQGGKRKDQRIHIFWQKRIREGDVETPWWYPTETKGGALGEGRIVLPIEPGTHWSDVKLVVLPGAQHEQPSAALEGLPSDQQPSEKKQRAKGKSKPVAAPQKNAMAEGGGLWFAPPTPPPPTLEEIEAAKPKREKRAKQPPRKNDPKLVAAAREFRDRYLEQVNAEGGEGGDGGRLLTGAGTCKYEVSRTAQLPASGTSQVQSVALPLLDAA